MLQGRDVLVDRVLAIQYLYLHADIGGVALQRGTDADTVVGARRQLELEAIDEVRVLILRIEVTAEALARHAGDATVLQHVVGRVACPLVHVRTVEQYLEACLLLLVREDERLLALQLLDVDIAVVNLAAMCLELDLLDREDRQL